MFDLTIAVAKRMSHGKSAASNGNGYSVSPRTLTVSDEHDRDSITVESLVVNHVTAHVKSFEGEHCRRRRAIRWDVQHGK